MGHFFGFFPATTGLFSGGTWVGFVLDSKRSQLDVLFKPVTTCAGQTEAEKMVV